MKKPSIRIYFFCYILCDYLMINTLFPKTVIGYILCAITSYVVALKLKELKIWDT